MVKSKFYWIPLSVVFLDQLTKFFFDKIVQNPVILIPNFLSFGKVYNSGAGFGMLPGQNALLIWTNIIVIGLIVYSFDEFSKKKLAKVGSALVLSGAIGNLFDRIFFGKVFDWITFSFWPSFNVADSAITIGAILFAIAYLRKK